MKVYLVGGAVRDQLLGLPVKERDYVVTGSSEEEMLERGFTQVGKGFPVFLHPKTHEEYALARQERKVAPGHKGFSFTFSPSTTLEEDLIRRDITINAIAQAKNGELIDPFGGQKDIKNKIIRHVSDAFSEDPLRVLRACRFKAKFPDFTISDDLLGLMKKMVQQTEFDELSKHRLWQELEKSLMYQNPKMFFSSLCQVGVMPKHLLAKVHWPFKQASGHIQQFCLLIQSKDLLDWIKQYFSPPNDFYFLATRVISFKHLLNNLHTCSPEDMLEILLSLKAFSTSKWLDHFIEIENILLNKDISVLMHSMVEKLKPISQQDFPDVEPGPLLGQKIQQKRIKIIRKMLADQT